MQTSKSTSIDVNPLGNTKLNEDIVVPLRNQSALIKFVMQLKRGSGLAIPTFGHAADGNFHVNIMFNRGDKVQEKAAKKAVLKLMKKVVELGGVITGEHGVGLAKSPFIASKENLKSLSINLLLGIFILFSCL